MNEAITKAVVEATRIMIQTIMETPNLKIRRPTRTQARWSSTETATI